MLKQKHSIIVIFKRKQSFPFFPLQETNQDYANNSENHKIISALTKSIHINI